MSFISSNIDTIYRNYYPLRNNVFEAVIVRPYGQMSLAHNASSSNSSTQNSTAEEEKSPNYQPLSVYESIKTEKMFEKFDFFRFLVSKVSIDGGSIELGVNPYKNGVYPLKVEPPRKITMTIRETKDMLIYRIFRDLFTRIYNVSAGYHFVGAKYLTGYVGVYDSFPNPKGEKQFTLVSVYGFWNMMLTQFPNLDVSWENKAYVVYDFMFGYGKMDYVSLLSLTKADGQPLFKDLSDFVEKNHADFQKHGNFPNMN